MSYIEKARVQTSSVIEHARNNSPSIHRSTKIWRNFFFIFATSLLLLSAVYILSEDKKKGRAFFLETKRVIVATTFVVTASTSGALNDAIRCSRFVSRILSSCLERETPISRCTPVNNRRNCGLAWTEKLWSDCGTTEANSWDHAHRKQGKGQDNFYSASAIPLPPSFFVV